MTSPIRILTDRDTDRDLNALDRAWDAPETFLYLAEKSGLDQTWLGAALANIPAEFHRDHFILLTSGSTGTPKLVVGQRTRAESLAAALHQAQAMDSVRETVLSLPLTYCFSFVNQWLWARLHSRVVIPTRGFADPLALRHAWIAAREAMICAVGTQAARIIELLADTPATGITRLHFAGGRFPQEHIASLSLVLPSSIVYNNYGCAEAMPRLTLRRADQGAESAQVGRPLSGIDLRVGAEGALEFRSPYAAVGFAHADGYTAAPEWMESGDLAAPNPDGTWTLLGRKGDVFKRHGEKISLPVILEHVRSVFPGALAYRDIDPAGEAGYALVLSPPPTNPRDALLVFRERFARAHWPIRLETLPSIPLLPNGKPDISALPSCPDKVLIWKQHIA
jgi:acyl-CoA synthetase (AMP-forming)/AMP-acid ligase II